MPVTLRTPDGVEPTPGNVRVSAPDSQGAEDGPVPPPEAPQPLSRLPGKPPWHTATSVPGHAHSSARPCARALIRAGPRAGRPSVTEGAAPCACGRRGGTRARPRGARSHTRAGCPTRATPAKGRRGGPSRVAWYA
ncbi:hypothetical protein CAC01_25000 [Streptomyces sp. CLI2509]|nr:hypothetical protein CAC01_25000 [Streptomyces sp. CLI2509]